MKFKALLEDTLRKRQLAMGIEVEKEHLKDKKLRQELKKGLNKIQGDINTKEEKAMEKRVAETIAKPHLKEMKNYYDKLKKMEGERAKK